MEKTFWAKIYMAGDVHIAKQTCREFCFDVGLCVNIHPTDYIYTGGEEAGFCVEVINYPRFPKSQAEVASTASKLARKLMQSACQHSYLIMDPIETMWVTRRDAP